MEYSPDKYKMFIDGEEISGYVSDLEIKLEREYEFNYDLDRMKQAVESETVYLPRGLKEECEILQWMLNYDKENNDK